MAKSALVQAVTKSTNKTFTDNGMKAKKSTLNANVDLFFQAGASRGKDILPLFAKAYDENSDWAIRIALWLRDVRQGAGERQLFRNILKYVAETDYKLAERLVPKVPELGRWDDLLTLVNGPAEAEAFKAISKGLDEKNGLLAKWMPRKGDVAYKLRKHLGLSPRSYRKLLVGLTNVVEQKMCANQWSEINYSHVPSLASARLQKVFGRHDSERYSQYLASLQKGEKGEKGVKINAGAVYPYDVIKSLRMGNKGIANEQWKALPDFVAEGFNFLPVCDVSRSMTCSAGGNSMISCLDVCISLGMYLSERNKSIFKDSFVTFSSNPQIQTLSGTLEQRYNQLQTANWYMSTNLEAVFNLILKSATKHKVSQDEMPSHVLILSDMQFNQCATGVGAFKMIKEQYKEAGYEMPGVIFWNLNSANNNTPVEFDKSGVALVSGFSPSIMRSICAGQQLTPIDIMLETIMNTRYDY